MKKLLYLSIVFIGLSICPTSSVRAQGVGINPSGNPPANSAMLDVSATDKGMLIPRLTTTQRDAITNPDQSLMIFNTTTNCFEYWANGLWQTMTCATCPTPAQPSSITGNASPCEGSSQTYSVTNVNGVTYTWSFPSGWTPSTGSTNSVTVTVGSGSGNIQVTPSNVCGNGTARTLAVTSTTIPAAPTAATHAPSATQIVWNWNTVSGATGYKYNTANDYGTATDNGTSTSYTQTGLTCNTAYILYVWAYTSCGNSSSTALNQTTSTCPFICGSTLTITHTIGTLAPETKTVNYGTVLTNLSGADKCWITRNLGADQQATSANDNSDASAGWYWQFNRKQGYKHDGNNRTPNTAWINSISENSNWLAANDPCTIELGAGWRIPTEAEWIDTDANGAWSNHTHAYNSVLKLHDAGFVSTGGGLNQRGFQGRFYGSTQQPDQSSVRSLRIYNGDSGMNTDPKADANSLRCIKD